MKRHTAIGLKTNKFQHNIQTEKKADVLVTGTRHCHLYVSIVSHRDTEPSDSLVSLRKRNYRPISYRTHFQQWHKRHPQSPQTLQSQVTETGDNGVGVDLPQQHFDDSDDRRGDDDGDASFYASQQRHHDDRRDGCRGDLFLPMQTKAEQMTPLINKKLVIS